MKCDELDTSCSETFNLYYYEADSDDASSTFPPWREKPYVKIDTIAAGERFSVSSPGRKDGINKKTWTLGPLSKFVTVFFTQLFIFLNKFQNLSFWPDFP